MYKLNNEFEINYNKEIIPKKLNPDLDKKLEKLVAMSFDFSTSFSD